MPRSINHQESAPIGDDNRLDPLTAAQAWSDRCTIARLLTNVIMFMVVWLVVAVAAFALMSR